MKQKRTTKPAASAKPRIGFIGQGYIGKNYADNFHERGFEVIRYSLEPHHAANKKLIKDCNIVFIAVPTPTTPEGSDVSIVRNALSLLGRGAIAVIKSTILPGTTASLQAKNKHIHVFHSPEFLTSATARQDADKPSRNVIGISIDTPENRQRAESILDILPVAPFRLVCSSTESEFIKYSGNTFYYAKVVYMNALYDFAQKLGLKWDTIKRTLAADPWIGPMHIEPIHKTGRGAGGHCLIKDYAAFANLFRDHLADHEHHIDLLRSIEESNLRLLRTTGKDQDIVERIYGARTSKPKAKAKKKSPIQARGNRRAVRV